VSGVIERLFATLPGDIAIIRAASNPTRVLLVSLRPMKNTKATAAVPNSIVTERLRMTEVGIWVNVVPITNVFGARILSGLANAPANLPKR
jgi:hypothetical protein